MTAWTCSACGGENAEGMRFCGHCGTPLAAEPAQDASETLRSFVSEPIADRLVETAGDIPEERRLITALFADVSGFTALADRLDPEDLVEVIDPVISGLSSVVGRYGGYVEKYAGDALLALFGAPVSHEDDAERALLVALEMHRELARMCEKLPHEAELTLHCGVNSGHGIARIMGSEARMDYAVLGDSVILAQRLESAAPKGETYVGELTYRLTAERFEFESVGDLDLKGKSEPVPAWRLLGARRAPRATTSEVALVGRTRELASIAALLDGAQAGAGGTLVVTGEPGVGKSRLVAAARERAEADGFSWLQTRCLSYGTSLAYWPYADLLRTVGGVQPQADAEDTRGRIRGAITTEDAVPYFIRLLGLPAEPHDEVAALEPEAFRRGLHRAFSRWLSDLAVERPLVLALEDAHWADASSLEVTRELGLLCADKPLVLCLSARLEAETTLGELIAGARSIHLEPLDELGIAELLKHVLGGPAPGALVTWVVERTTGNPFFVEELVRALRENEILVPTDGRWSLRPGWEKDEVPPTVEGLLASRIDLLPRSAAEVLRTASVIGRVVPVPLLEAVFPRPHDLAEGVETLVERRFLDRLEAESSPAVTFHHALVQDVAYSRLLRRQRRDLHRRVAELAESMYGAGDDVVDLLARHLYLGEAGSKAVDYLVRAGERARLLYANDEAIVHFSRAAELAEHELTPSDRRAEILLSLADLRDLVGEYDEAIRLYSAVREQAAADVRAWRGLAAAHRKRGEYELALAAVDEALVTDALRDADLIPMWLERGWSLSVAGRFREAIEVLETALAAAGERRDAVIGQLLLQLTRAETVEGEFESALEYGLAAQAIFEERGDLRGLATALRIVGDAYTQAGRLEEAVGALSRGLDIAERVGSAEEIGGCLINLGWAEYQRGELAAAIGHDRRAIEEFERIGHGSGRARGYANLADKLARTGEFAEALSWCDKALDLSRAIGHSLTVADVYDTMAFIHLQRGAFADASERAEEAASLYLEMAAAPQAAKSLEIAASAWEKQGDEERARDARARARALARSSVAS